jgi:hypothetical protein
MPVTFSCACGKTLRIADEHAGKRVKCPACQAISTVPAPLPPPPPPPPPPPVEPEPEFEIVEEKPRPVRARPVVKPRPADDDEDTGAYGLSKSGRVPDGEETGTYGLSKGSARGRDDDDGPRDKPLPDFRLGSGQRGKKRKKK